IHAAVDDVVNLGAAPSERKSRQCEVDDLTIVLEPLRNAARPVAIGSRKLVDSVGGSEVDVVAHIAIRRVSRPSRRWEKQSEERQQANESGHAQPPAESEWL